MATITRIPLSSSTNGKGIKVAATTTPGTTIHTALSGSTTTDEVWLWAQNNHTAPVTLTVEYGSYSTDDNVIVTIPSKSGLFIVLPGLPLQNALVATVFASVTNVVVVHGFVNRIAS